MDLCFNCGTRNDPDTTSCRACGGALIGNPNPEVGVSSTPDAASPSVELISRTWDEVVETVESPTDPFEDISPEPLAPGTVEVSVDNITVIETAQDEGTEDAAADEAATEAVPDELGEQADETQPVDPWDHLRPHGELPPLQRFVSIPGRVAQITVLITAIGALASAGIHFYLNTRLEAGTADSLNLSIEDIELAADWSLLVVVGLFGLAALMLVWWMIKVRATSNFRPGKAGLVALFAFLAGSTVTGASFAIKMETVNEAIAANSLIVLGLGLLMTACLAVVRTVDRIDRKEPA